jgi:hypothetical protein
VPERYLSRNSVRAIANYRGGHIWLFHDQDDPSVPASQSEAVAHTLQSAGLPFSVDISQLGDVHRWTHDFPDQVPDLIAAETVFMPSIVAKVYPEPPDSEAGTFLVAGYVDTKHFRLTLGAGDDETGSLVYDTNNRVFTITTDRGATPYILILKGQVPSSSISATVNGDPVSAGSDSNGNVAYQGTT